MTLSPTTPAELSCRVARSLLIHVRKHQGRDGVERICKHVGLAPEYFSENNWISYATYLRMLEWLVDLAGNERAAYEQGLEAASLEAYGALYIIIRSFATPAMAFRTVGTQAPRFSKTGTFAIREVHTDHAIIEFVNRPECPQHRLNCLSIQGQLAAIPTSWDLPPAWLEHPECQVDGAPRCTYRLRWVARPSFGIVAALIASVVAWATVGEGGTLGPSVPFGAACAALVLLAGTWLDQWKVLRDNRHMSTVVNERMAMSLEAVENALEAVQRRNRVLESLRAFSAVAAAADSQQPLVRHFLAWVSTDLGYQRCGFLLADPRSGLLRLTETVGVDATELGGLEAVVNAEVLTGTLEASLDVRPLETVLLGASATHLAPHFEEAVPLSQGYRIVGVLLLGGPPAGARASMLHDGLQVSTAHLGSALVRLNEIEMVDDAFMNLPTALAILDEDLRVLHTNPAVAALFAATSSAGADERLLTEALLVDLRDVLHGAPTRSRDIHLGGRLLHASVFELPPSPTGGKRVGIALTDLEERESLVRQLVQSEKLASIGLLASGIAHQLNNPLFGIMGLAEAILDEEEPERVRAHARKLLRYGEVSADIIRDLGRYARAARTMDPADPLDLGQVLEEAVDLVRYAGLLDDIEVVLEPSSVPPVWGSFQEILQVFVNLLHNASDALEGRGSIRLRAVAQGGFVEAAVADSGPGIAPEHLESLFEPFFTTKPAGRGTGLGLAVVQRIVNRYNGTVRVESVVGSGTTFFVRLPLASANRMAVPLGPVDATPMEPPSRSTR